MTFNPIWSDAISFDSVRFHPISFDSIQLHLIPFDSIWFYSIPLDSTRFYSSPLDSILLKISESYFVLTLGNQEGAFAIDVNSGQITVNGTIDAENKQSYTLHIRVSTVERPCYNCKNISYISPPP